MRHTRKIFSLQEANDLGLSVGFVGKVINVETKKIIGYTSNDTFDSMAIKAIDPTVRQYEFYLPDVKLRACGVDVRACLLAFGFGCEYEEEWGDFSGFMDRIEKEGWKHVSACRIEREEITDTVLHNAVTDIKREAECASKQLK